MIRLEISNLKLNDLLKLTPHGNLYRLKDILGGKPNIAILVNEDGAEKRVSVHTTVYFVTGTK